MGVRHHLQNEHNRERRKKRLSAQLENFYLSGGAYPSSMIYVLICKRMGIAYKSGGFEDQPALYISHVILDAQAENRANATKALWEARTAREGKR